MKSTLKEKARELIARLGADRLLFGTDYPFWPQRLEVGDLFSLGLTEDELEKICWRNAAKLYDLRFDEEATDHA